MPRRTVSRRRSVIATVGLVIALVAVAACAPPVSPTTGMGGDGATVPGTPEASGPVVAGQGGFGPLVDWQDFVAIHLAVSPTGDVLMWDRIQGLTSARRWNPATGAFTSTPGLNLSLFCAFQTRLPDGRLAVVGGTAYKAGNTGINVMQFFDWSTNTWTAGPSLKTPRWYPTVIELPDGRLVSLGGQVKAGTMANLTELYNPTTNTWTELTGLAESKPMGLYPRAILAPNGKVFVVKNAQSQSAYMDVDTQTWTNITKAPPNVAGGGMAMYESGKILLYNIGSTGTDSWVIDLNAANPTWRKVGSLQYKRKKFSTVLLPDGRVMAIGGSIDGTSVISKAVLTPEIWDPATETWTTLPNLAVPRMYHSNALLLPDGRVLTAGGGRAGSAPNFPSSQIYSPSYLSAPNRPSISAAPAAWAAGSSVNLTVSSANGVSSVVLMGVPGVTHGLDTQQRRMTLPVTSAFNAGTGAISVQVPSVANAASGHYYVIALDSRGVPTEAKIVRLVPAGGIAAAAPESAPSDPNVPREVLDVEPQEED